MSKAIPHENLVYYHEHFINTNEKHYSAMPEYFRNEVETLKTCFSEFHFIYKSRTNSGSETKTAIESKNNWLTTADDTLKRTSLFLKSALSETEYKTYIPNGRISTKKDIERLSILKRIMTTSELRNHKDLADKITNINELIRAGDEIFKKSSVTKTDTKEEVTKLAESKEKWLDQFQKLRYLYRGYFHGSKTDYTMFFKDMNKTTKTKTEKENAKTMEKSD